MGKHNHRRTLQQYRKERPMKPTRRQRKHDEMMETLDGRLQLYCKLKGIMSVITSSYIRCTMPSEVILTIYKKPMRFVSYNSRYIYGVIDYPWRRAPFQLYYLNERAALHLFNRMGEQIDKIENGKPLAPKTDAEPQQPVCNSQKELAENDRNILKRCAQFIFGYFKQKQKEE